MIEAKRFLEAVLEAGADDLLLSADSVHDVTAVGGDVAFRLALMHRKPRPGMLYFDQADDDHGEPADTDLYVRMRAYGGGIMRVQMSRAPTPFNDASPMLDWHPSVARQPLALNRTEGGYAAESADGASSRFSAGRFALEVSPDDQATVRFQSHDQFLPNLKDALAALTLDRADGTRLIGFATHIAPGENFCGTGERFERPNLLGQQLDLVNFDAAGVNNDRTYKNVPLLLSSRGYGLFVHSSARMRLDIGRHSNRSLSWLVEDDVLDLFVIGGGSLERVLYNYRRLTGFPPALPAWSYGVWMSRASYTSADEVTGIARRMREEGYPADVLHLDVGWFDKEWMCDWEFSKTNFPDPEGFLRQMDAAEFKVTAWQFPHIQPSVYLANEALAKGYVGTETERSHRFWLGYTLDLTKPEAVAWYQGILERLMRRGIAAIKADFGEQIDEGAIYGMDARKYWNLFCLLYQRAVWEATERVHGKGNAVIWARAGWAGAQRYPVHWGGDAAATFDGLASTISGGLHFGLSGYAYWSHDVGGIHGIPDFMVSRPSEELYVRWTQFGVFSSHMRYHGGTPREPWEYPGVSAIVRQWLRLRYALLPYLLDQAEQSRSSGLPMLRSLVLEWTDDPAAWSVPDQYMFGDAFLVCPIVNEGGERNVYLPDGRWTDLWTGAVHDGPVHLKSVQSSLWRMPLFVRYDREIEFAEPGQSTRHLDEAERVRVRFDESYTGFDRSPLARWITLEA